MWRHPRTQIGSNARPLRELGFTPEGAVAVAVGDGDGDGNGGAGGGGGGNTATNGGGFIIMP